MFIFIKHHEEDVLFSAVARLLVCALSVSLVFSPCAVQAQSVIPTVLNLPVPGAMVTPSPAFVPVLLKGMTIHPDDPLRFDFIIDSGNSQFTADEVKKESERLVKYFLAAMTVPKDDLWVNLSPYEQERIIPNELGKTELGRDMLAQDYILKQLTASLMYPEEELGKKFWDKVYKEAQDKFGTSEIPVNTFNKVWIVPETAVVYEHEQTVYVVDARLRVMLDADYVAMESQQDDTATPRASARGQSLLAAKQHSKSVARDSSLEQENGIRATSNEQPATNIIREIIIPATKESSDTQLKPLVPDIKGSGTRGDFNSPIMAQIVKEILIPAIEVEVNEGAHFAPLRQIYHSLILAKWYKETVKNSLLSQVYVDQNKIAGVEIDDPALKDKVYAQYIEAYKKGVFNYIKEDVAMDFQQKSTATPYAPAEGDRLPTKTIPRKYFSGGLSLDADVTLRRTGNPVVGNGLKGDGYTAAVSVTPQKDVASSPAANTELIPFFSELSIADSDDAKAMLEITKAVRLGRAQSSEFDDHEPIEEMKKIWPSHKSFVRGALYFDEMKDWPYVLIKGQKVSFNNVEALSRGRGFVIATPSGKVLNAHDIWSKLTNPPQELKDSKLQDIAFNPVNNSIALLLQYWDYPEYGRAKFFIIELSHNQAKIIAAYGKSDKRSTEKSRFAHAFDIDSKGNYYVLGSLNLNDAEIHVFNQRGELIFTQEDIPRGFLKGGGLAIKDDIIHLKQHTLERPPHGTKEKIIRAMQIRYEGSASSPVRSQEGDESRAPVISDTKRGMDSREAGELAKWEHLEGVRVLRGGKDGIGSDDTEMLALVDENGEVKEGEAASKIDVHKQGLWHMTSHVYIVDQEGRLLFKKRSMKKKSSAGKLQVPVSGHVNAGETPDISALREAQEEIGITLDPARLTRISGVNEIKRAYGSEEGINNEFTTVYKYLVTDDQIEQIRENYNFNENDEYWLVPAAIFEQMTAQEPQLFSRSLLHIMGDGKAIYAKIKESSGQSSSPVDSREALSVKREAEEGAKYASRDTNDEEDQSSSPVTEERFGYNEYEYKDFEALKEQISKLRIEGKVKKDNGLNAERDRAVQFLGLKVNSDVYVIARGQETFGAVSIGKDIYIEQSFLDQINAKGNPSDMRTRVFVHVLTEGAIRTKHKMEYEYAKQRFPDAVNRLLDPVNGGEKNIEQVIMDVTNNILGLSSSEEIKNNFGDIGVSYVIEELSKKEKEEIKKHAEELSEIAENALYKIAINALNGVIDLSKRIRLQRHPDEPEMTPKDTVTAGMLAFAANPPTFAHALVAALKAMAESRSDVFFVSATYIDFRKPWLGLTYDKRQEISQDFFKTLSGGLIKVMPRLPEDNGINGEEKVLPILELNKGAQAVTLWYGAGDDHYYSFARDNAGKIKFATISEDNIKDFRYYVEKRGYADLIKLLLETDSDAISSLAQKEFLEQLASPGNNPVDLLKEGRSFPVLDTIGKLWLIQKEVDTRDYPAKFVLGMLNVLRKGSGKDALREDLNFPTVHNHGASFEIAATILRNGVEKLIKERKINLVMFEAMSKGLLRALLQSQPAARKYLYSLVRLDKGMVAPRSVGSMLPVNEGREERRHYQLREALSYNLSKIMPDLLVDESVEGDVSKISVFDINLEKTLLEYFYSVHNALDGNGNGKNTILVRKIKVANGLSDGVKQKIREVIEEYVRKYNKDFEGVAEKDYKDVTIESKEEAFLPASSIEALTRKDKKESDLKPGDADVLIIPGNDDLNVYQKVLELKKKGVGKHIFISGGWGQLSKDIKKAADENGFEVEMASEAEMIRDIMVQMAQKNPEWSNLVNELKDEGKTILEKEARYTVENFLKVREKLIKNKLLEGGKQLKLLYIQKPIRQLRTRGNFNSVFANEIAGGLISGISFTIDYQKGAKTHGDIVSEMFRIIINAQKIDPQTKRGDWYDPQGLESIKKEDWINAKLMFEMMDFEDQDALVKTMKTNMENMNVNHERLLNNLPGHIDAFARAIIDHAVSSSPISKDGASSPVRLRSIGDLPDTVNSIFIVGNWDLPWPALQPAKIIESLDTIRAAFGRTNEIFFTSHFRRPTKAQWENEVTRDEFSLHKQVVPKARDVFEQDGMDAVIIELPHDFSEIQGAIDRARADHSDKKRLYVFENNRSYPYQSRYYLEREPDQQEQAQFIKQIFDFFPSGTAIIDEASSSHDTDATKQMAAFFPEHMRAAGIAFQESIGKALSYESRSAGGPRLNIVGGAKYDKISLHLRDFLDDLGTAREGDTFYIIGALAYGVLRAEGETALGGSYAHGSKEQQAINTAWPVIKEAAERKGVQLLVVKDHRIKGLEGSHKNIAAGQTAIGPGDETVEDILRIIQGVINFGRGGIFFNGGGTDVKELAAVLATDGRIIEAISQAADNNIAVLASGGDTADLFNLLKANGISVSDKIDVTSAGGTIQASLAMGVTNTKSVQALLTASSPVDSREASAAAKQFDEFYKKYGEEFDRRLSRFSKRERREASVDLLMELNRHYDDSNAMLTGTAFRKSYITTHWVLNLGRLDEGGAERFITVVFHKLQGALISQADEMVRNFNQSKSLDGKKLMDFIDLAMKIRDFRIGHDIYRIRNILFDGDKQFLESEINVRMILDILNSLTMYRNIEEKVRAVISYVLENGHPGVNFVGKWKVREALEKGIIKKGDMLTIVPRASYKPVVVIMFESSKEINILDTEFYGEEGEVVQIDSDVHYIIVDREGSASSPLGGIDMNDINVDRQGAGVDIQFDPVEIQEIIDLGMDGFAPVIINITPLPSVLPLLGLQPEREDEFELSQVN